MKSILKVGYLLLMHPNVTQSIQSVILHKNPIDAVIRIIDA